MPSNVCRHAWRCSTAVLVSTPSRSNSNAVIFSGMPRLMLRSCTRLADIAALFFEAFVERTGMRLLVLGHPVLVGLGPALLRLGLQRVVLEVVLVEGLEAVGVLRD